jgi:alkylation response protein AidB-like acyl-CoA dehydrogenase
VRKDRSLSDHQLLEKWFRDIKVYDIFEGTGQIQRT